MCIQAEMSASNCMGCTARVLRLTSTSVPVLENLGRLMSNTFCPSDPGKQHMKGTDSVQKARLRQTVSRMTPPNSIFSHTWSKRKFVLYHKSRTDS